MIKTRNERGDMTTNTMAIKNRLVQTTASKKQDNLAAAVSTACLPISQSIEVSADPDRIRRLSQK